MINGTPYPDTDGNVIHAHGGYILQYGDWYYWYGEDRRDNIYVSCWKSRDLKNWQFCSHILTTETPAAHTSAKFDLRLQNPDSPNGKVNVERPKVLYNEKTGKFVLWAHWENGVNYLDARCCIASSDRPDSGFIYHGSFNPYGHMSRDCTLFTDLEGDTYFISAARDNADLHIYRLTEDWLNVDAHVRTLFQHEYREAPALFTWNGEYYMITSYCTGWAPNQAKWSKASRLDGRWTPLENIGDETTYRSQSAFMLQKDGKIYYIGDRWGGNGEKYFTSTYVVLEVHFGPDGKPYMEWSEDAGLL